MTPLKRRALTLIADHPGELDAEAIAVSVRRTLPTGGSWHESMSVGRWRQDFEMEELRNGGRGGDRGGE